MLNKVAICSINIVYIFLEHMYDHPVKIHASMVYIKSRRCYSFFYLITIKIQLLITITYIGAIYEKNARKSQIITITSVINMVKNLVRSIH